MAVNGKVSAEVVFWRSSAKKVLFFKEYLRLLLLNGTEFMGMLAACRCNIAQLISQVRLCGIQYSPLPCFAVNQPVSIREGNQSRNRNLHEIKNHVKFSQKRILLTL